MTIDSLWSARRLVGAMEGAGFMMKIVLQNRVSWTYYGDTGLWVDKIELAHSFASSMEALAFAQTHKLRNVQIVFKFPKDRYDFTVLVRDSNSAETPRNSI